MMLSEEINYECPLTEAAPLKTVEMVLRLYQEQYFALNVRHLHEKLSNEHCTHLSYTWVKQALQGVILLMGYLLIVVTTPSRGNTLSKNRSMRVP